MTQPIYSARDRVIITKIGVDNGQPGTIIGLPSSTQKRYLVRLNTGEKLYFAGNQLIADSTAHLSQTQDTARTPAEGDSLPGNHPRSTT